MKKNSINRKRFPVKRLLLAVFLIIIIGIGSLIYLNHKNKNTKETIEKTASGSYINYNPPTEEEIKETQNQKDLLNNKSQSPPTVTADNKIIVNPVITNSSQNEIRAYISGVVENGGICTATFTKGSSSFTRQSTGFSNVSTSICEPITLKNSDFSASGTWTVVLSYSSDKYEGKSPSANFEVKL